MSDYIHAIVKYPALYKTLRDEGINEINNIRWEKKKQKVRNIYDKVLLNY